MDTARLLRKAEQYDKIAQDVMAHETLKKYERGELTTGTAEE